MPFQKTGPLSQAELKELWLSSVDRDGYAAPLLTQPNSGIEFIEQHHAQLARVSLAADRTFQQMYILPFSGQTYEPAGGAVLAEVSLVFNRTGQGTLSTSLPVVLQIGIPVDHAPFDASLTGPEQIFTGRRYFLSETVVFCPGQSGPVTARALSERPFAGYNLPQPNTITVIDQAGSGLENAGASVQAGNRLVLRAEPDVVGPAQVGQYIVFTSGANLRRARRIIAFEQPSFENGGIAVLAQTAVLQVSGTSGVFIPGELVTQSGSGATAIYLGSTGTLMVVDLTAGTLAGSGTLTGSGSGAVTTVGVIDEQPALTVETNTASWRVLDWAVDLGVVVTNPESPTGGRTPMLDALGAERLVFRSPSESDDSYRERVSTPADTVAPNAIQRAMNRVLAPFGQTGCLREVGSEKFVGFFYDGDPTSVDPAVAFAYDLDFDERPEDRFKLMLDYAEFRGFMMIGVPSSGLGEFGFAYDESPYGAYDASPFPDFYDGFPTIEAATFRAVYDAVNAAHAGGVGFVLYREDIGCM